MMILTKKIASASITVYRALLRLYPGDFREQYSKEMEQIFRAQLRDTLGMGGLLALAGLWASTFTDLIRSAIGEHLDMVIQDLRYGLRLMLRNPSYTFVIVAVLAIAIGANTAIFSVINAVLLRPLPYPQPEQLVQLWEAQIKTGNMTSSVSPHCLKDWQERNTTFEAMASYSYKSFTLLSGEQPEWISGLSVSANFFRVLKTDMAYGRDFLPEEEQPGNNRVVIISNGLWQRRFGSDPKIVGQTLRMNGESVTVIGITPAGFQFPNSIDLWSPHGIDLKKIDRGTHFLFAIGRLKPGVSVAAAHAEMEGIGKKLAQENDDFGVNVVSLHDQLVSKMRKAIIVLFVAVCFVLLIACANVTNIQLSRAIYRQKEIAVRMALGAGRRRIIRQLVTEGLMLSFISGIIGLLLAHWSIKLLVTVLLELPSSFPVAIDNKVLAFTILLSFITGIVTSVLPAFQFIGLDINHTLKEAGRAASASLRINRLRSSLVVVEVALAMVLLIGAGLLISSFYRLINVDPGFNTENLMTMAISLPRAKYATEQQQIAFTQELLERARAIEGIEAIGAVNDLPFSYSRSASSLTIPGRAQEKPEDPNSADFRAVSPDYFRALGIPVLRGRNFTDQDNRNSTGVVIINERMARQFWPNEEALGKTIIIGSPEETKFWGKELTREVVAVVGDIKHNQLDEQPAATMYVPLMQAPSSRIFLAVRARGESSSIVGSLRKVVASIDKDQSLYNVRTMAARIAESISSRRANAWLLGCFAAVTLLLAAIGIYGVLSFSVSQRLHEIGIRIALGASQRDILKMIVGQGLLLAMIGVGVGVCLALALTRLMTSMLYGVSAVDPVVYLLVPGLVFVIALLACFLPARRALKVDPIVVLRYE